MKEAKKSPMHWFAEKTSMHGIPSLIKSTTTSSKAFLVFSMHRWYKYVYIYVNITRQTISFLSSGSKN